MTIKVFLTGGDTAGWALDDDLAQVRTALLLAGSAITVTDTIEAADLVHTVWPLQLQKLGKERLKGKKVITHLSTDPASLIASPHFSFYRDVTTVWVAQSEAALKTLPKLGLKNVVYVPYAVDPSIFSRNADPILEATSELAALKAQLLSVASDHVIIGSFQRDSEGANLNTPKLFKGPDILLELADTLQARGVPIHFLLVGPRRHWLRAQFNKRQIPYTFFGDVTASDDYERSIVSRQILAKLYRLVDLYIVSSRSEGGPRAILEASACETPLLSTPVGIAPDLLTAESLFSSISEGCDKFFALGFNNLRGEKLKSLSGSNTSEGFRNRSLTSDTALKLIAQRLALVYQRHTPQACAPLWQKIYEQLTFSISPPDVNLNVGERQEIGNDTLKTSTSNSSILTAVQKSIAVGLNKFGLKTTVARLLHRSPKFHVSLIYKFHKPPYGGGNQFFLALQAALRGLGVRVSENRYSSDVDVFLLNSNWFPVERFQDYASSRGVKVVHRIDGPTELVRGDGNQAPDKECFALNAEFATLTIMQSMWSFAATLNAGYQPKNPCVIPNGVDPKLFFKRESRETGQERTRSDARSAGKLRLIASSWSDNPRKGSAVLQWMDANLDWSKYEMTFVGRVKAEFENIKTVPAVDSKTLGALLRAHDVYFTASECDPCSNALIEGLTCGLPAIYRLDGGHPELVSWGGLGFTEPQEIPGLFTELAQNYERYRNLVTPPTIEQVAQRYVEVMRVAIAGS